LDAKKVICNHFLKIRFLNISSFLLEACTQPYKKVNDFCPFVDIRKLEPAPTEGKVQDCHFFVQLFFLFLFIAWWCVGVIFGMKGSIWSIQVSISSIYTRKERNEKWFAKKFCTSISLSYQTWSEMKGVRCKIICQCLFSIV
jgi:hypothetical protein